MDIYHTGDFEYEDMFKAIEEALGFRLFTWQKYFIVRGKYRQSGKTTAYVLRQLMQTEEKPMDLSNHKTASMYAENTRTASMINLYIREVREIKEKLDMAGIKTRTVFFTEKQKREYTTMSKTRENYRESEVKKYGKVWN